jgi:hypothetical protein
MMVSRKMRAWAVSGCVAIGLITLSSSARAEVLFDSLSSQNSGVVGDDFFTATAGLPPASIPALRSFV